MSGYVKIYQSILDSSIWQETQATRLVWITLLAMADRNGRVEASVSGVARRANVQLKDCELAIEALCSPDKDDKSKVLDGRRLQVVDRGWFVVNHKYYRDLRTEKQISTAERVRRHREKKSVTCNDVTLGNTKKHSSGDGVGIDSGSDFSSSPSGDLFPSDSSSQGPVKKRARGRPRKENLEWSGSFALDERMELAKLADTLGLNLDAELLKIGDWAKSKGERRKDWAACVRGCLRREAEKRATGPGPRMQTTSQQRLERIRRIEAEEAAQ